MKLLKLFGITLLRIGVLLSLFYLIVNFTLPQSIFLAILITFLYESIKQLTNNENVEFSPYFIHIAPNWFEILIDFKLIKNDGEWNRILNTLKKSNKEVISILKYGFTFQVVHESTHGKKLIYLHNNKSFASEINHFEDLNPIAIKRKDKSKILGATEPVYFFIKDGIYGGIEIGMELPKWWWLENKEALPKDISQRLDAEIGYSHIVLATIPYSEFQMYWDNVELKHDDLWKAINENRKHFGWEDVWKDKESYIPEYGTKLSSKYFTVNHNSI